MGHHGGMTSVPFAQCRVVLAHGAGSSSRFLERAFPAEALGAAECRYLDDRTGRIGEVMTGLAAAAPPPRPTVLGGVSLGAHATARLLARPDLPAHVVGGLVVMPAWTGPPGRVADMTAAAADAVAALGTAGVLAELDPDDWVTPLLAGAWAERTDGDLVAELAAAATQPGPDEEMLRRIRVPVGIVALGDDPLHPESVARRWHDLIPHSALLQIPRSEPATDLSVFGATAGRALAAAQSAGSSDDSST